MPQAGGGILRGASQQLYNRRKARCVFRSLANRGEKKKPHHPQKEEPITLIISGSASVSPVRRFLVFWNRRRLYLLITGKKEER